MSEDKKMLSFKEEAAILQLLQNENMETISLHTGYTHEELMKLKYKYIDNAFMKLPEGAFLACRPEEITKRLSFKDKNKIDIITQLETLTTDSSSKEEMSGIFEFARWLHMQIIKAPDYQESLGSFLHRNFALLKKIDIQKQPGLIEHLVEQLRQLPITPDGIHHGSVLKDILPQELIFKSGYKESKHIVKTDLSKKTKVQLSQLTFDIPFKWENTRFVLYGSSWYTVLLWYHSSAYTRAREGIVLKLNEKEIFELHWPWIVDTISAWVTDVDYCDESIFPTWMEQIDKNNCSDVEATYTALLCWWMWGVSSCHSISFDNGRGYWSEVICE